MGRPSKLTDAQWDEVKRRVLEGEKPADLAREYKVSKSAISTRVSKRVETVKTVANQIVATERALSEMSVSEQILTTTLAGRLRTISDNLAQAAEYGSATALRLHALANAEVQKVDDAEVLSSKSLEAMKGVMLLSKVANEAAESAHNLLSANKDRARTPGSPPPPDDPLIAHELSDEALASIATGRSTRTATASPG